MDSINLVATEFNNYVVGSVSYGWRMYSDYDSTYCNFGVGKIEDDLELLQSLKDELDERAKAMLLDVKDNEYSMFINEVEYQYCEISDIINDLLA